MLASSHVPPRLKAFFLLAFALLRTVVGRVFGAGRGGLAAFRKNYAADGLAPVTSEERAVLSTFGGCIACGLCDRGEAARIAKSNGAYRGVMEAVLAGSRSMPDYGAAALALAHVPDAVLEEKERICPTRVPMRALAKFVRDKSGDARVSLPTAGSGKQLPAPR
ncbi:MAG TPA: hypothetical protein VHE30_09140 [Polyangiaceae bacterium]|nr:hypothetical protein [Polyangiaceae bacterium]